MARPKRCKICTCADPAITGQLNSLVEAHVKQRLIHEQHPEFSVSQISRHTRFCLAVTGTSELPPSTGSVEIHRWLRRAEECYLAAQANGDSKSAVSAISTAVRSLCQLEKQLVHEAETEKDGVDRDSPEFTIAGIDAMLRQQAEHGDIQDSVAARTLTLLNDEVVFGQIVQSIWTNRSILPALLTCCVTDYLPPRQTVTEETSAND